MSDRNTLKIIEPGNFCPGNVTCEKFLSRKCRPGKITRETSCYP